ncbi:leukotriene A-4 hydrolase-like isoform X1 [Stegodyphus dumicola]|uniref:leukotriene A-4 hydrolase-like isoform X1 n=2 Tax=Stegodyphus dumicola TaxID=202533 RepID=UPI0015ACCD9D|nr:leukotriene A-4 hydrolase-like isoform X1 [Stegodyphus dumicola]
MGDKMSDVDPNSYSNPEQCIVTDINLNLEVDFSKHILKGYVDLYVERKDNKSDLVLDTKDLVIHCVRNKNTMNKMSYELGEPHEKFGTRLEVKLLKRPSKKCAVRIEYETSPKASALQWLEPNQTAGKKHPYMFSQCQAIHARSVLPCQDTPFVKTTYSADISAPYELIVLMSAVRDGEEIDDDPLMKKYKFVQKVPIPSYLIAIVVGALESREIGPRSHVWAEKEYIEQAAEEFSETEKLISTAEELLGEYVWEVYDLLVLPPSFPFGGMENPCLTFVTPTLLAGDKSLVDVIAHEISHSWTGNLVTNKNFEHFWLNEGFTVFVERKILGRLHGEDFRKFHALGGWKELKYTIDTLGEDDPLTNLVPDLKGVGPDDAFSSVPYEKGHTLLYHLEELLGGAEVFEKFLRDYIEEYKYQSVDTDIWKSYLYKYFPEKEDVLNSVDWNSWLYTPGMPPVKPDYDCDLAKKCVELSSSWIKADDNDLAQFTFKDIENFSSHQICEFLSLLLQQEPLSVKKLEKLDEVYKIGTMKNSEIHFRWIRSGLRAHWKDIVPHAVKFATEQGRMKFVRPIYRDLYNWDEVRETALSTYRKHSPSMMYVTAYTVGKDLHLSVDQK